MMGWARDFGVSNFGTKLRETAENRYVFFDFWNMIWPETRMNIDFGTRPVTPGVAGSSPVRSAI